ncbi:hypothetical protein EYF80_013386 [Liparis tanakae]|uniref:Uncharacterized protein n=1 Tax=Liparis tanakae TaxID=230148 RepID=A0A4Z2IEM8_9TELE|nr:hypothetical protein EYF80_013386 [Liparis tanakae]
MHASQGCNKEDVLLVFINFLLPGRRGGGGAGRPAGTRRGAVTGHQACFTGSSTRCSQPPDERSLVLRAAVKQLAACLHATPEASSSPAAPGLTLPTGFGDISH